MSYNNPTTSQKHRDFTSEPMRNKSVNALPGVGGVLGERLKTSGYSKAKNVLGEYLVRDENKASFQGWMKDQVGANQKQSGDTYNSLQEYQRNFL
ncbi:barrier-to-autointegration factor-like [Nasonia vitripennis]|uniref:Barrier-to-autointegration factor n=1 Tax=Nasonia vitripennis TaxID=7425 RepID=A0A7M7HCM6_NASVI|nr:barrier-to-autointegration factor-like [Nasonia vitripennis]XP_008216413.1 barrier-to-autointegration factor-like [Nasonia vitripennis]